MKKILANLSIIFCLAFTIMGVGGCSSCSPSNETGKGEQAEVETITTLEGIWESERDLYGIHEKIVVDDISIRCYVYDERCNGNYRLIWAGIYVPFAEPINEGTWTFNEDVEYYKQHEEEWGANGHGIPVTPNTKIFNYSNEKLSCNMESAYGEFRDVYFKKVSD